MLRHDNIILSQCYPTRTDPLSSLLMQLNDVVIVFYTRIYRYLNFKLQSVR